MAVLKYKDTTTNKWELVGGISTGGGTSGPTIKSASIDSNNHLIFEMTDNSKVDAGDISAAGSGTPASSSDISILF